MAADQSFLDKVETSLSQVLVVNDDKLPHSAELLIGAARYLCILGEAKRIRPQLVSIFSKALSLNEDEMVPAACAAELIHSASLLHDDVIDEARVRRGRPSVNAHFSTAIAVLSGNYLMSAAFSLLERYPISIIARAVDVIGQMTKAAVAEIHVRGEIGLSLQGWREIAFGKTGTLFAWCGEAAAIVAGNDDAQKRFARCGLHMGVAFQMADDLRDLVDESGLKDRFSDIRNREPTYPLLLAIGQSEGLQKEFAKCWQNEQVALEQADRLGLLVLETGVQKATCEAIWSESQAALDALGYYRDSVGGKMLNEWLENLHTQAKQGFKNKNR